MGATEAGLQLIKGNTNEAISFCRDLIGSLGEPIGSMCFKGIGTSIMMFVDSLNKDNPLLKRELIYLAGLCQKTTKYSGDCYSGIRLLIGTYKDFNMYLPSDFR